VTAGFVCWFVVTVVLILMDISWLAMVMGLVLMDGLMADITVEVMGALRMKCVFVC
jgi:hypothetical protein